MVDIHAPKGSLNKELLMRKIHPFIILEAANSPMLNAFVNTAKNIILEDEENRLKYYGKLADMYDGSIELPEDIDRELVSYYAPMYLELQYEGFKMESSFSCNALYTSRTTMGIKAGSCVGCKYENVNFSSDKDNPVVCDLNNFICYMGSNFGKDKQLIDKELETTHPKAYKTIMKTPLNKIKKEFSSAKLKESMTEVILKSREFIYGLDGDGRLPFEKMDDLELKYGYGVLLPEESDNLEFFRAIDGGWNNYPLYGWVDKSDLESFKEAMGDTVLYKPKNLTINGKGTIDDIR